MEKYTLYCTEEQTKKAFELNAPLIYAPEFYIYYEHIFIEQKPFLIPTTEQIIGWLRDNDIFININYIKDYGYSTWVKSIKNGNHLSENLGYVETYKKAISNAIDFSLDYLTVKSIYHLIS